MEEKQLDFNQPLLSVRRFSSNPTNIEGGDGKRIEGSLPKNLVPPVYNSELKSGAVRNPGNIPFQWEQIPGRPKDGEGLRSKPLERPPITPKLPPGRILNVKPSPSSAKSTDKESESSKTVKSQTDSLLSPAPCRSFNFLSTDSNAGYRCSSSLASPLPSIPLEHKDSKEDVGSDSDDCDAFTDAVDTLSYSESCFLNCSLSGVSAWDSLDMRPVGGSVDLHNRKFMMDRFLPAAKAMASETPQHNLRKQPLVRETVREMNRGAGSALPNQIRPKFVPRYSPGEEKDGEGEEDDAEEEDYDDTVNLSAKACGFVPQCLKNSLFLLNPIFHAPGMKIRRQMHLPSAARRSNLRIRTSDHGPLREAGNEHSWEAVYKHKLICGIQNNALPEDIKKPTSDSAITLLGNGSTGSATNQPTSWSESEAPDGFSPYRRSTGGISPYRNEAHQSPFQEGMGFLGFPKPDRNRKADGLYSNDKGSSSYSEISNHSSKRSSGSASPAIEKTLYVDSVHMLQSPNSKFDSSDTRELMLSMDKDSLTLVGGWRIQENGTLETSIIDKIDRLDIVKAIEVSKPTPELTRDQSSLIVETNTPSCADKSILRRHMDMKESRVAFAEDLRHVDCLAKEASSLACSKEQVNGSTALSDSQPLDEEFKRNPFAGSLRPPLPPPLPKSPSESWLLRTLPVVSSPKASSRSFHGVRHHPSKVLKTASTDPKWETIVKTSNVHHSPSQFSEEVIAPVSQKNEN